MLQSQKVSKASDLVQKASEDKKVLKILGKTKPKGRGKGKGRGRGKGNSTEHEQPTPASDVDGLPAEPNPGDSTNCVADTLAVSAALPHAEADSSQAAKPAAAKEQLAAAAKEQVATMWSELETCP